MRTTQRLYEAAYPIWEQCHDHPFVRGIGDGSLDLEKFQWFLLQDYLYLFDYARVFAYGVVKARDPGLMRTFSANVDAILGGEMKVHRAYMARLGITEEQVFSVQPALSNLSYTHYMLSCAAAGGPAEIIAAILSCSWSYAEIGTRLAAIPGAADHPFYGEWIRSYAGEDYQKTNDALVELTGALAGFTLALNNNRMVGMAGFITGVAATLSMAASEYLSKKADTSEKHPLKAAVYTGVAYMITVAFLLLPYIVFESPLVALGFCLFDAALIILGFTYFVSVVRKESFVRGFTEMITISFSVAGISFLIGWAARSWLSIDM